MTEPTGRRERKKAATRRKIADTALRLFLEQGYDAVGIREVAARADVAVTTLFAYFPAKEALVFDLDQDFEQLLTRSVLDRAPEEPLVKAVHGAVREMVRHCSADEAAPLWRMIDATPALLGYERAMRQRHAESLARAIAADRGLPGPTPAVRALARLALDAFSLARESDDPAATLDDIFPMIEAAAQAISWPTPHPTA
jgi:AcrR family transcriptional regulator